MATNLTYNHTTDISGPVDFFFQTPNQLSGGVYGIVLLSSIFAISFISMQRFGIQQSLAASGFLTFIVAVIFASFGIVSSPVVVASAILVLVGVMLSNGGETL